jgi:Cu(I)/Ag(I) efflux system membrane fusion protein
LIQGKAAVAILDKTNSSVLRSTAEATLEATRDKLRLFGLTTEQVERIERTRETSDHLTIYAPIGGVVVHKDAKEGMYVSTGTRIYTIADLSKLWVTLEAYESDLPWLRYGQHMGFTSPSFPGERFEAVISFIDPLVDPKTRTVRVRAVVENRDKRLKPDMFVHGVVKSRFESGGNIIDKSLADKWIGPMHPEIVKNGPGKCDICGMALVPAVSLGYVGGDENEESAPLLIPVTAPLITGKRAVVYVEIPNDKEPLFEGREVTLGPRAGDFYIVHDGIEEGELVVTNGAFKIDSELQIQAKPSMMSPSGGAVPEHQHDSKAAPATSPIVQESVARQSDENTKARNALAPVYKAYFDIHMALAKDELAKSKTAGKDLTKASKQVDISVFSRANHARWMELSVELSEQAGRISGAGDIETARDAFYYLSKATIELHASFSHADGQDYYLTHCPMARGGDGAYWLQKEETVWNAYYGKSMPHCGSINQTLTPRSQGES